MRCVNVAVIIIENEIVDPVSNPYEIACTLIQACAH